MYNTDVINLIVELIVHSPVGKLVKKKKKKKKLFVWGVGGGGGGEVALISGLISPRCEET